MFGLLEPCCGQWTGNRTGRPLSSDSRASPLSAAVLLALSVHCPLTQGGKLIADKRVMASPALLHNAQFTSSHVQPIFALPGGSDSEEEWHWHH